MKSFWQKNKWTILSLGFFLGLGIILTFKGAEASSLLEQVGEQEGVPKTELPKLIGNIIKVILSLLGVVLVVMIIWSGVQWMTAGGEKGDVQKAKDRLQNAIIGLVIVVAAYALANFIINSLNKAVSETGTSGTYIP